MNNETNNVTVSDNPEELRYELRVDGALVGEIRYRRSDEETVLLVHTDVDPSREGEGLGAVLVRGALDDIRARGQRVVPFCPFVAAYIRHHPEYNDLVTTSDETPD
jgi:predicted GNAT family acetyltransferase